MWRGFSARPYLWKLDNKSPNRSSNSSPNGRSNGTRCQLRVICCWTSAMLSLQICSAVIKILL
jgi:hypothetical protein